MSPVLDIILNRVCCQESEKFEVSNTGGRYSLRRIVKQHFYIWTLYYDSIDPAFFEGICVNTSWSSSIWKRGMSWKPRTSAETPQHSSWGVAPNTFWNLIGSRCSSPNDSTPEIHPIFAQLLCSVYLSCVHEELSEFVVRFFFFNRGWPKHHVVAKKNENYVVPRRLSARWCWQSWQSRLRAEGRNNAFKTSFSRSSMFTGQRFESIFVRLLDANGTMELLHHYAKIVSCVLFCNDLVLFVCTSRGGDKRQLPDDPNPSPRMKPRAQTPNENNDCKG